MSKSSWGDHTQPDGNSKAYVEGAFWKGRDERLKKAEEEKKERELCKN